MAIKKNYKNVLEKILQEDKSIARFYVVLLDAWADHGKDVKNIEARWQRNGMEVFLEVSVNGGKFFNVSKIIKKAAELPKPKPQPKIK